MFVIESRETLHLALDAIIRCNATDEAYVVAGRAGYHELFPGCIYRDEEYMSIAASTARQIIKQAKADDVFDGAEPEDDATAITTAEELVEMAEQAWASNVRGPEVEKILRLAAADGNGGAPESDPTPEPSTPAETPSSSSDGESNSADGDDEQGAAAPSFFSDLDEGLRKIEPYEGYGDERVKDVTDGIVWYSDQDMPLTELGDILKNIWAFETAHKNRSRILKFVIEAAKKKGLISEEEDGSSEPEPRQANDQGSEEEAEDRIDASDEESDVSGQEQRPEPSSEAPSEDANADDDPEPASSSQSSQGSSNADESVRENQSGGSGGSDAGAGSDAYRKLIDLVDSELKRERLDIPAPPTEEAPDLPWNWAQVTDEQLQDFHMQYAAMAYYKGFQRSREDRIAWHCRSAADEIHAAMLVAADKYDEKNKAKTQTLIDAEIESDPRVKKWRKLQKRHEAYASNARQEMDGYYKLVEALSRIESMRDNAWKRSQR